MTDTVISSGQSVTSQNVASGDGLTVFGIATSSTVFGGGLLSVSSGGTATATAILSGAEVDIDSNGTARGTIISSGGTELVSTGGLSIGSVVSGGLQTVYGITSGVRIVLGEVDIYGSAVGISVDEYTSGYVGVGNSIAVIEAGGSAIAASMLT